MSKPTIRYGDDLKQLLVDGNYISRGDQRFPYLGVAYIEWEDAPPNRSKARFSVSCHECSESMLLEPTSEFTGFWGMHKTCPSCGVMVEIGCFRAWDSGFQPGLFVIAMPGTRTKGASALPIELRILEIRPVESK